MVEDVIKENAFQIFTTGDSGGSKKRLPVYTASLFRHNVGHSMAMSGASAPEIAYILGQSSYVVADRYIAATLRWLIFVRQLWSQPCV
jgi:hypothetical protein